MGSRKTRLIVRNDAEISAKARTSEASAEESMSVNLSDLGIHQHSSQRIKPPVFSGTGLVSVSGYDWEALPSSS